MLAGAGPGALTQQSELWTLGGWTLGELRGMRSEGFLRDRGVRCVRSWESCVAAA